jgi:hypothetical protein
MVGDVNCAQWLRPVGQLLEPLGVESFALQVERDGVAIRAGKPIARQAPPPQEVSLRAVWQALRGQKSEPKREPQPRWETVELHYTHDDIARMDSEAKSRRSAAGNRAEAHALAQILRAVGAFVDQKQGRLIGVTKEGQEIAIEYESAMRQNLREKFTVASLYDYWVKMYLRRRERS